MILHTDSILDEFDRPVSGAQVYVYNIDGSLATLTIDGTVSLTQPILSDEFGIYSYYANTAYYNEDIWFGAKKRWRNANVAVGNPGADLALRSDLAASTGSVLVSWIRNAIGAVARTLSAIFDDASINPKDFGAKGDAVLNGAGTAIVSGTDDTAAIQAALTHIGTLGSGTLRFPRGKYLVSSYLTIPQYVRIKGAGRRASIIVTAAAGGGGATAAENVRNGAIIYSLWPSNASTPIHLAIEHIGFWCTNVANVGAAIYDNGGGEISIRNTLCKNFKYGIVLDQSEKVDISECNITPAANSGACVWLVNGASLTAGNTGGFTNRISVKGCQLGGTSTVTSILDDGGTSHSFIDNNYSGGLNAARISGVTPFQFIGGEFESFVGNIIEMFTTTSTGTSTGGSSGAFYGGIYSASSGHAAINVNASGGNFDIGGNIRFTGGGGTNPITGTSNASTIGSGLYTNGTAVQLMDGAPTIRKDVLERQTAAPGSGAYRLGHVVFNRDPAAGSILGWRNILTGIPGTWEAFYSGFGTNAIGYATGAGGAITQLTSRTTSVQLDKLSGAITLFSAAGTATWQTFTVTNSTVAATDVIRLNQKSGTDLYMLHVTNVAAGSFKVSFATTGGTTTEQPVFNFAVLKAVAA